MDNGDGIDSIALPLRPRVQPSKQRMNPKLAIITLGLILAAGPRGLAAGNEVLTVLGVPDSKDDLEAWVDWNDYANRTGHNQL